MIFDAQGLFSENQAITATAVSTNVVDLGTPGKPYGNAERLARKKGEGYDIPIRIQVTEDFATLTSLTIAVVTSDSATLASGNVTHWTSVAIPVASLKAGYVLSLDEIPNIDGSVEMKRYLGLTYTVGGSNATTGKITAGIVMGVQTNA